MEDPPHPLAIGRWFAVRLGPWTTQRGTFSDPWWPLTGLDQRPRRHTPEVGSDFYLYVHICWYTVLAKCLYITNLSLSLTLAILIYLFSFLSRLLLLNWYNKGSWLHSLFLLIWALIFVNFSINCISTTFWSYNV